MAALTQDIFDDFYNITKFDAYIYLSRSLSFMQNDYLVIQNFYQGKTKTINALPFQNFTNLKTQTNEIFQIFQKFGKQFNNLKYWNLLEQIEEVDNRLKTLTNINRWSRSSIDTVGYNPNAKANVILNQNGSLERISKDLLSSSNPNDDWVQIAIDNNLTEEDYTSQGGTSVNVTLTNKSGSNFNINSIIDVINGPSIYGLDIQQNLEFDYSQGYNDLVTLSYQDTIIQAIAILSTLKLNDNPDFPNNGLQSAIMIGQSKAALNFPIIARQLAQNFSTDDSLKNFSVTSITYDQDNLIINFTVSSRLNEIIQNSFNYQNQTLQVTPKNPLLGTGVTGASGVGYWQIGSTFKIG